MRPLHARPVLWLVFTALLTVVPASAQTTADAVRLAEDLLVPIHTQPADEAGGPYGLWAAGPDYKVSFHDGFCFYPLLGAAAPRHLPLHWRTESIFIGERELLQIERLLQPVFVTATRCADDLQLGSVHRGFGMRIEARDTIVVQHLPTDERDGAAKPYFLVLGLLFERVARRVFGDPVMVALERFLDARVFLRTLSHAPAAVMVFRTGHAGV